MPKSKEFVSSSESDSDSEPKSKKAKPEKRKKEEPREEPKEEKKKPKKSAAGEYSFQLSKNRFASVSEFRGKVMVGIREFYEVDGELKPGKKGISLPLDQWKKLKESMDDIDEAIRDLS